MCDAQGNVLKWVGSYTDVHEQRLFAETLERQVTERTQALKRSNEELERFAHVTSHDLKEPVRKIKVFASRLQAEQGAELSNNSANYLEKINRAAERMYSMIEGILEYSTLGAQQLEKTQVDLSKTLATVRTELEMLIADKRARISESISTPVWAAPQMIHQLLYNLVGNALKFSSAQRPTVIEVTATVLPALPAAVARPEIKGPVYSISVRDNGIGFDQQYAGKLFQAFSRLNAQHSYEGTGLGLMLCRKIAERHGGAITAAGQEGEGACFTVYLPVPAVE